MAAQDRIVLIIHGGAGSYPADDELIKAVGLGCREAAEICRQVLESGGSAVEAAVRAVMLLEDNPVFNAGPRGAHLNKLGLRQLDAGIAVVTPDGKVRNGGVGALPPTTKNPILVAHAVMLEGRDELPTGLEAERFARLKGIPAWDPSEGVTDRVRLLFERWQQGEQSAVANNHTGTVGAVVRDRYGNLCAAGSTGGATGRGAGALGDVAIFGAGFYSSSEGAACATGDGEKIRNTQLCRRAVDRLLRSAPRRAAELALEELTQAGGQGGLIVVSSAGDVGHAKTAPWMSVAFLDREGSIQFDA